MPPKGRYLPQNVEFQIASLRCGRRSWFSGVTGAQMLLVDSIFNVKTPKYQTESCVVGKVSDESLIFEMHKVDYSPASIRKLLRREMELLDEQFSPVESSQSSGYDSNEELERPFQNDIIDMIDAYKAFDLASRRSIKIRFKDIVGIDIAGDTTTMTLSSIPICYAKIAGKSGRDMEVSQDFTGSARSVSFKSLRYLNVWNLFSHHCPRLESLITVKSPSTPPPVMLAATPNRKRTRGRSGTPPEDVTNDMTASKGANSRELKKHPIACDPLYDASAKRPRHRGSFWAGGVVAVRGGYTP
jgi:hypothetical protein